MRKILVILFLLSSLTVLGQSKVDLCESGMITARKRLARGQIYFPRYIFDSTITLRKILEMDYGIIDDLYSEHDFGFPQEYNCHDSLMLKAISDRWGPNFLEKQRQLADMLIKEGRGYKTPSNIYAEEGIDQLVRKGYADNGMRLKIFEIHLVVSTTGKIVKHEIHALSKGDVTIKEIEIINDAISKYSDNWTPGGIKGNPIEMKTSIEIGDYVVTGPK